MSTPCLFLDRDGTIIVEKHYLGDPAGAELEIGVGEALARLASAGYMFVVVSNQSGIGRGIITLEQMHSVNARVAQLLGKHGVTISGWYYCPHRPDEPCDCRKPRIGMITQALQDHDIDMTRSAVIGDKDCDVQMAEKANLPGFLILTGRGASFRDWANDSGVAVFDSLSALANSTAL